MRRRLARNKNGVVTKTGTPYANWRVISRRFVTIFFVKFGTWITSAKSRQLNARVRAYVRRLAGYEGARAGKYGVCRRGCAGTRRVESKRVASRVCGEPGGLDLVRGSFVGIFFSFHFVCDDRRRDDANRGLTNMFFERDR